MSQGNLWVALVWGLVGVPLGIGIRRFSIWMARREELESGSRPWQIYGPPALTAALFAIFALQMGAHPLLLVRSLWIAVLVQIIFFDFEHRLILDWVQFPAMAAALLLSILLTRETWWQNLLAGIGMGLVFLLVAGAGALIYKGEAMGLGDVKLAVLMGLILGVGPHFAILGAIFLGVMLAGVTAIILVVFRVKTLKDPIAYGPYLAFGTLVVLYEMGP